MSNLEQRPTETACGGVDVASEPELLAAREVPLGGPRAMTVRRTLPHRERRMVGAWCFVDHYGPHDLTSTSGMDVPPHPHTGLQTVSWLLEGEVLHHDSLGSAQMITPGQLNLMTAGRGIAHSEQTPDPAQRTTQGLSGVQLWVALPAASRDVAPTFEHHAELPVLASGGGHARVVMGSVDGVTSPAVTYSPLVGAEVSLPPGGSTLLPLEPSFEHAVLAMDADVDVAGRPVRWGELLYLPPGARDLQISADRGARVLLIGGEPFDEHIVMWWNFVGTDHDAIAEAREQWQAQHERFGSVDGYDGGWLNAPALPNSRLKARGRTRST
jgi:redox-sensitive bicupin YhaK (pirin superfamily)